MLEREAVAMHRSNAHVAVTVATERHVHAQLANNTSMPNVVHAFAFSRWSGMLALLRCKWQPALVSRDRARKPQISFIHLPHFFVVAAV